MCFISGKKFINLARFDILARGYEKSHFIFLSFERFSVRRMVVDSCQYVLVDFQMCGFDEVVYLIFYSTKKRQRIKGAMVGDVY